MSLLTSFCFECGWHGWLVQRLYCYERSPGVCRGASPDITELLNKCQHCPLHEENKTLIYVSFSRCPLSPAAQHSPSKAQTCKTQELSQITLVCPKTHTLFPPAAPSFHPGPWHLPNKCVCHWGKLPVHISARGQLVYLLHLMPAAKAGGGVLSTNQFTNIYSLSFRFLI